MVEIALTQMIICNYLRQLYKMNSNHRKKLLHKKTFYAIYDLNHQIALLPDEQKKEIVRTIHSKRMKGEKDDLLKLELERAITKGKLQISDDLDETKLELSNTKKRSEKITG